MSDDDDEPHVFAIGQCVACKRVFTFNPLKVPSIMWEGSKEPVCGVCVAEANRKRIAAGMPPHFVHPDAYEAMPAKDMPDE